MIFGECSSSPICATKLGNIPRCMPAAAIVVETCAMAKSKNSRGQMQPMIRACIVPVERNLHMAFILPTRSRSGSVSASRNVPRCTHDLRCSSRSRGLTPLAVARRWLIPRRGLDRTGVLTAPGPFAALLRIEFQVDNSQTDGLWRMRCNSDAC